MPTEIAILEGKLGLIEFAKHRLDQEMRRRHPAEEAKRLRAERSELERRRSKTLELLDQAHEEYEEHQALRPTGRTWGAHLRE